MAGANPTNIRSRTILNKAFKLLWSGNSGSECYDRADFWSYQMSTELGIESTKVFVFFTNKYKREINGQWWFHAAPGVIFQGVDYIMDPEFVTEAMTFERWINGVLDHAIYKLTPIKIQYEAEISKLYSERTSNPNLTNREKRRLNYIIQRIEFLESELERMLISNKDIVTISTLNWPYKNPKLKKIVNLGCKEITDYSEYLNNQESEYCYIIRSNMFYRAPRDIENLEKKGLYIYELNKAGLRNAFSKAFRGRFPYKF